MVKFLPERNHAAAKTPSPFMRYFKARLQPFSRPLFWGAAAILTLLAVGIWQYWTRSELNLTTDSDVYPSETSEQDEIEASQGETTEGFPALPPSAIVNEDPSALKETLPNGGFLGQSPENAKEKPESAEAKANSAFTPLPGQKTQPNNPFAASDQELLNRAALKDYRSLLGGSSQPADASESTQEATPTDLPTPTTKPVPGESSLEKAVNRVFTESASSSRTPTPSPTNLSPQPSIPTAGTASVAPEASTPFSGEFNNSFRPAARSYQSPYPVTSGSPNPTMTPGGNPGNPVGSSVTNPYNNTYSNPYSAGGQAIPPAQPQTPQYQGTNRPSYYTTPNPVPNQYQPQNPYAPQVQEPVRMDSPLFP